MYKDNQTKSVVEISSPRPERSSDCEEHPSPKKISNTGDIENQMHALSINSIEVEKLLTELFLKIEPILTPESISDGDKDVCNKEEQISPLATDMRVVNYRLICMKSKIVETLKRIQL